MTFGPVTNGAGERFEIDYLESRALMLLWIAHFIVHAHGIDLSRLRVRHPEAVGLTWHLQGDFLVGDNAKGHRATSLVQCVLRELVSVRMSFARYGENIPEYILADNLAGLLNENAWSKRHDPELDELQSSELLLWHKLS